MAIADRFTAEYILNTTLSEHHSQIKSLEPALGVKNLYVGFSNRTPGNKTLCNDFNKALSEMYQMGIIGKIMQKHGLALY